MKADLSGHVQTKSLERTVIDDEVDREDDLSREVFGILGLPIDVIDLESLLKKIDEVVGLRLPFLMSTPNVNFLMLSRSDDTFRESLLMSDLCPVDGMPLVWVARLLGIPIQQRLSGSDIFDALRMRAISPRVKVFLFGGGEGVADMVAQKINHAEGGLSCVGALNPGFGSIDDMSSPPIIDAINASRADLLTVFLSAAKAQVWLLKNYHRLTIPLRVQLGATINLQAGKVRRAPPLMRELGLEWLWRIKEEPYLWPRYLRDGASLMVLLFTKILPLAIDERWQRFLAAPLQVSCSEGSRFVSLRLSGPAITGRQDQAVQGFRQAFSAQKAILVDLSEVNAVDARFFGLFIASRKKAIQGGITLQFINPPPRIRRKFRRNGFEFLLNS